MNILKWDFLLVGILMTIVFAGCNNQNNETAQEDEPVTDAVAEPIPTPVGELGAEEDAGELTVLLREYMDVKEALVEDEFERVKDEAKDLLELYESLQESVVTEQQLSDQQLQELRKVSSQLAQAQNIEQQRQYFATLSNQLYQLVQQENITNKTLYWQHCPMAMNNKGANWLSFDEEIQNPYMGQKMPKCGSVQETLNN